MRILSFDTSTEVLYLALLERDQVIAEERLEREPARAGDPPRQEAVARLLPSIDSIMRQAGWPKDSLDLLVVGEGPGSFTGIRTGVVTARTLAQALGLPLVAVCSLQCYASMAALPAIVVLSAGRGHYFIAGFDSEVKVRNEPAYVGEVEMLGLIARYANICADDQSKERLVALGHTVNPLPNVKNIATRQAQIAWNRVSLRINSAVGSLSDAFPYSVVEPLYLRSPSVTIKRPSEKTHGN